MADLDIAPPPPPKFLDTRVKKKERKLDDITVSDSISSAPAEKKWFSNMFKKKEKPYGAPVDIDKDLARVQSELAGKEVKRESKEEKPFPAMKPAKKVEAKKPVTPVKPAKVEVIKPVKLKPVKAAIEVLKEPEEIVAKPPLVIKELPPEIPATDEAGPVLFEEEHIVPKPSADSVSESRKPFFSKVFKKKKKDSKEPTDEDFEMDIERVRTQLGMLDKNEKDTMAQLKSMSAEKPAEKKIPDKLEWDADKHITTDDEYERKEHERWDVDDPHHLKDLKAPEPVQTAKPEPKPEIKAKKIEVIDTEKVPIRKAKRRVEAEEPAPVIQKPRRSPVDKAIAEYFRTVENEQKIIQRELTEIAAQPTKALRKKTDDYIIHHNEKLIRSMRHLLTAIKSIDDVKFQRQVQNNKRAFQRWVNTILEMEKKAEEQRNKILKVKLKELFKAYTESLSKDMEDKKYELSEYKKETDQKMSEVLNYEKKVQKFDSSMKKFEAELNQKKDDINSSVEAGISKRLDKAVRKERNVIQRTENKLKSLVDEYSEKHSKLMSDLDDFKNKKSDARKLLKRAEELSGLDKKLERKDMKLKGQVETLKAKEAELSQTISELEKKERDLVRREDKLAADVEKLVDKDEELYARDKELQIEVKDFETRKREFALREKEIRELEEHVAKQREEFQKLKEEVLFREKETDYTLREVREIAQGIEDVEYRKIQEAKKLRTPQFEEYFDHPDRKSRKMEHDLRDFNEKIKLCRGMIGNNQIDDAKRMYSEIRSKFTKSVISSDEKETLYNMIRELYDDIHLTIISNA